LEGWHTLFPEAQLWTAQNTQFTLKKNALPITSFLMDTPYQGWKNDLDQLTFKGNPLIKEVLFFHKESHTVIMDGSNPNLSNG